MEGHITKHDMQRGCVRYLEYDTQEGVSVQIDDPIVLQQDGDVYMRVKMVDGELVYNRFGEGWDSIDEPLTQRNFIEVGTTSAVTVGQDINSLSTINISGSKIQLASASTVTLQPGTYKIEMSAAFDFSADHGYAQIIAYDHSNHTALVSPNMKSSVYVYAQALTTFLGQNSNSFIMYTGETKTICFRPAALVNVDSLTYFSAQIHRL